MPAFDASVSIRVIPFPLPRTLIITARGLSQAACDRIEAAVKREMAALFVEPEDEPQ